MLKLIYTQERAIKVRLSFDRGDSAVTDHLAFTVATNSLFLLKSVMVVVAVTKLFCTPERAIVFERSSSDRVVVDSAVETAARTMTCHQLVHIH